MNIRTVEGTKQINCFGYFQVDFFSLDDLVAKQKSIYNLIEKLKENNQDASDMIEHYDVTEQMRVKLLKSK